MVWGVVVWRLGGRVGRRVLVVHGIVRCCSSRLSLLVGMSRGSVGGGAGWHLGLGASCRLIVVVLLVLVVVDDDDLFGQAVPVELIPVGASALGCAGAAVGHVGRDWGELLRLALALGCPA